MSLLLATALALGLPSSGPDDYTRLVEQYEAEESEWTKKYADIKPDAPESVLEASRRGWPGWAYAPRFLELAEKEPPSRDALLWVVNRTKRIGPGDRRLEPHLRRALEILAGPRYRDDGRLVEECGGALTYPSPWIEKYLRDTIERTRSRDLRGGACLGLGMVLAARAQIAESPWFDDPGRVRYRVKDLDPDYVAYIRDTDLEASRREAEGLLRRCAVEFADVVAIKGGAGRPDVTVGRAAWVELFKLTALPAPREGRSAPEIEGVDADGARFKLSDYRGKVVLLSFSGNWCGPCRAMYPEERRLVEELKDRPFALLSVNTDEDRETLKESIAAGEVTWRCWWDGGVEGPITRAWGVVSFPTVHIIDQGGVIRHSRPQSDQVRRLVDELLASERP